MTSDTIEQIKARMAECEKANAVLEVMCTWITTKETLKVIADARMKIKFMQHNDRNLLLISETQ